MFRYPFNYGLFFADTCSYMYLQRTKLGYFYDKLCRHAYRLCAVYAEVDALSANAEAVELRVSDAVFREAECAVLLQPYAVDGYCSFAQGQVFQVEHRVGSTADVACDAEGIFMPALAKYNCRKKYE